MGRVIEPCRSVTNPIGAKADNTRKQVPVFRAVRRASCLPGGAIAASTSSSRANLAMFEDALSSHRDDGVIPASLEDAASAKGDRSKGPVGPGRLPGAESPRLPKPAHRTICDQPGPDIFLFRVMQGELKPAGKAHRVLPDFCRFSATSKRPMDGSEVDRKAPVVLSFKAYRRGQQSLKRYWNRIERASTRGQAGSNRCR